MHGHLLNDQAQTYGFKNQNLLTKLIFLIGRPKDRDQNWKSETVLSEIEAYGDILQEDFLDTYTNLTLKSIMLLKWVNNSCGDSVNHILKVDDDSFINVPNLLHILLGGTVPIYNATIGFYDTAAIINFKRQHLMKKNELLLGHLFCRAKPVSDAKSKWYSPYYLYNKDEYPPYLSGTAYLMSLDVAKKLYIQSLSTPYFHLEDVYITGLCATKMKIKRLHHPLFYFSAAKTTNKSINLCSLRGMVSEHHLSSDEMMIAFDYVFSKNNYCQYPSSKIYNLKRKLSISKSC